MRIGYLVAHRIQRKGDDNFVPQVRRDHVILLGNLSYDFHPELGGAMIDLEDDSRFLEIYNLCFMELNRDAGMATFYTSKKKQKYWIQA
jgi:alanyl-tRNA synthetase